MTDKHEAAQIRPADPAGIAAAAQLLRAGGLVALPTETVYGLAARADSAEAVAAIYRAKGRPDFNPLIVHVPSVAAAQQLAVLDHRAARLAAVERERDAAVARLAKLEEAARAYWRITRYIAGQKPMTLNEVCDISDRFTAALAALRQ